MYDKILQSQKEYSQYLYNRIIAKIKEAQETQLLCYALLGLKLGLRQSDILALRWDQVDFNNKRLNKVKIAKMSNRFGRITEDYDLDDEIIVAFKAWKDSSENNELIFPNYKKYMPAKRIGELIGIPNFSHIDLRNMYILKQYVNEVYCMTYKMDFDGRYQVFSENGELLTQTNDFNYAVEVMGNNTGSKFVDTAKEKKSK